MSDYPMLISNKLHSFRNFALQNYKKYLTRRLSNRYKKSVYQNYYFDAAS